MKKLPILFVIFLGMVHMPQLTYAQEESPTIDVEQSAEVFLEEYSDEFQENFFEALKQKGIENYDKAINLLLKCKQLDGQNIVVDHELAKVLFLDKQFPSAEEYALVALQAQPENPWYLDTFLEVFLKQGNSIDDVANRVPYENDKLKENLAMNLFKRKHFEEALSTLKSVEKSPFSVELSSKIEDALEEQESQVKSASFTVENTNTSEVNSMKGYTHRIEGLLRANNHMILKQVAGEALENFPSQPFFYYAQGLAFNKTGKHREAIEVLEVSLDYLVGDISLANKIYTQLSEAYNGINNPVKANMYLRKIKPGF